MCICRGCGRPDCCVGYTGSLTCGGTLKKKSSRLASGHCTSCVCRACGAAGFPCHPWCEWTFLGVRNVPPNPATHPLLPALPAPSATATATTRAAADRFIQVGNRIYDRDANDWLLSAAAAVAPASATTAATAAVPPEEHGPAQAAPEPTTADLLYMIQELQTRLTAVEQELADNRYWQWRE